MSKQYENTLAKEMYRASDAHVRVYTCGYSGNNAIPQPDVLVTDTMMDYALEMKGPIQSDTVYIDADDLEQLRACQNSYTAPCLVIKFAHREPLVVRYFEKLGKHQHPDAEAYNDMSTAEKFQTLVPDPFDPRVTDSGVLALDKPDTDDWPSAKAGSDDVDAVLSGLGIDTENSVEIA